MSHWIHIIESLVRMNARPLACPDNLIVCVEAGVFLCACSLTFFPHRRKFSCFIYSDGLTAVYPSFLRTDGWRKSRRLSAGISIVMQENFRHYGNFHASLREVFYYMFNI
jgi:hypothetical protein